MRVFNKLHLKECYLQIELDYGSKDLTTFHTPWERWKFIRMAFIIAGDYVLTLYLFKEAGKFLVGMGIGVKVCYASSTVINDN